MLINNVNELLSLKRGESFSYRCKECNKECNIKGFRREFINNYKEFLCPSCLKIKRYGYVSPFSNKDVQDKITKANIEKYDTPYPLQSKEIHDKISETCLKRYGSKSSLHDNGEIEERVKKIFNEKYGVDRPLQSKIIYNKTVESNKNNHNGKLHTQTEEWKDKVMKTFIDHYGVDNPMKSSEIIQKSKESCLIKYGVDNPMKSQIIKDIIKQDRLNNPEKYTSKRSVYHGLSFDSIPEFCVYKLCLDFFIPIVRNYTIGFDYIGNKGITHKVYPDFIINGQLVEIKGSHFFREDGTMYLPYRNPNWSDEEYKSQCDHMESKRQSLINNGVLILKDHDPFIIQCVNYVFETYGLDYINSFSKSNPLNNSYGYSPFDIPDTDGYYLC